MKKQLHTRLFALVFLLYSIWGWGQTTVTYTVATTSSVTKTGTSPTGSSASYSQTYNTINQITKNNSATLTLSGYTGAVISKITLSMRSSSSSGGGEFIRKSWNNHDSFDK